MAQVRRSQRVHDMDEMRHATWLELFFDLVVVVAVARLGGLLHDDHDLGGVLTFAGLLVVVWWVWISFSYFADLFDDDGPLDRVAQLLAMLGAAILAVTISGGVGDDSRLFAGVCSVLFLGLGALYLQRGLAEPRARELCRWYVAGSWIGAGCWAISMAVPTPGRYWVWALAVTANSIVSGPLAYARMQAPPEQRSHMPERFGLFVIVVLGEGVLAVVNGVADVDLRASGSTVALAGFAVAACIWWKYFDHFDEEAINRAIAGGRLAQVRSFVYGYGHLLVYASIVVVAVGTELAIEEVSERGADASLLAIGSCGVALSLFAISTGIGRPTSRLGVVGASLTLVFVEASPVVTTVALAIVWVGTVLAHTMDARREPVA